MKRPTVFFLPWIFLFSSFLGTAFAQPYLAILPEVLQGGEFKSYIGGSYFKTHENLDTNGTKVKLSGSNALTSITGDLYLSYGVIPELTLFVDVQYLYNTVSAQSLTMTAMGLGDQTVGFRAGPKDLPIRVNLEGSLVFPSYTRLAAAEWARATSNSTPPFGNGTTNVNIGARLEVPASDTVSFGLFSGYTNRSLGFSNFLSYEAYLRLDRARGWFVRMGAAGQLTLFEDQNTGLTVADRNTSVIGGSLFYNAINPTFIKADLLMGVYPVPDFFVSIGGNYPVTGKNIAIGPTGFLAIGLDLGGRKKESGYEHSNRGFQEYYLRAKVLQVNTSLNLCLIDKGRNDDIRVGEYLDVFEPENAEGKGAETVARAKVLEIGPTKSKLKVLEYYKEVFLEEGFVVKRPVR